MVDQAPATSQWWMAMPTRLQQLANHMAGRRAAAWNISWRLHTIQQHSLLTTKGVIRRLTTKGVISSFNRH
jgi:hypothetical protein